MSQLTDKTILKDGSSSRIKGSERFEPLPDRVSDGFLPPHRHLNYTCVNHKACSKTASGRIGKNIRLK